MAKVTKTIVDKDLRDKVFNDLFTKGLIEDGYTKINDRQWGTIITDLNGERRYVRVGAIVAELREDMTAEELMESEIAAYQAKQNTKAEKAKAKQEKIAADKERRKAAAEAKQKAKEEEEDDPNQYLPHEVTY